MEEARQYSAVIEISKKTVVRAVGAVLAIVIAGAMWFSQRNDDSIKPTLVTSIEGDRVSYLGQQVQWTTNRPVSLLFGVPVPENSAADERKAISDKLFSAYAGPRAEELGFRSVVLRPDDGTHSGEFNILGFKFTFSASVGTGDLEPDSDLAIYIREGNGAWTRDGAQPGSPSHIAEYALPSGARFALTEKVEDFPSGVFVFDCLTCRGRDAIPQIAGNFYALLRAAVPSQADADGLKTLKVIIFLHTRRSAWDFPQRLTVELAKRSDGEWIAPKFSTQSWEALLKGYYFRRHEEGKKLRRER